MNGRHSKNSSNGSLEITSLPAIEYVLNHQPEQADALHTSSVVGPRVQDLKEFAQRIGVRCLSLGNSHSEKAKLTLKSFAYTSFEDLLVQLQDVAKCVVLALDHIQDPQNFGALCRSAEAMGVAGILIPKDRSVAVTSAVYSASVGAVATLPVVRVTNLAESLRQMKEQGFWIVGAAQGGTAVGQLPKFEKKVLVLGAEGEGLGRLIQATCDCLAEIPMRGRVESFNVSVAGALLLYELTEMGQCH